MTPPAIFSRSKAAAAASQHRLACGRAASPRVDSTFIAPPRLKLPMYLHLTVSALDSGRCAARRWGRWWGTVPNEIRRPFFFNVPVESNGGEGLKVPKKQPKRGRLWLTDESCIRLRPECPNHVWSFDFAEGQTRDGRRLRLMTLLDEFTRKCLAIRVARRINSIGVIETLADVMLFEGIPTYIRSDNGPEMVTKVRSCHSCRIAPNSASTCRTSVGCRIGCPSEVCQLLTEADQT
jgi:hypothetical protein